MGEKPARLAAQASPRGTCINGKPRPTIILVLAAAFLGIEIAKA